MLTPFFISLSEVKLIASKPTNTNMQPAFAASLITSSSSAALIDVCIHHFLLRLFWIIPSNSRFARCTLSWLYPMRLSSTKAMYWSLIADSSFKTSPALRYRYVLPK